MSEKEEVLLLAHKLLDEPNADPDDNLRILSRQLLRREERVVALIEKLAALNDGTRELVEANRDSILRKHEEAVAKIKKLLGLSLISEPNEKSIKLALQVIARLNEFHPMHGESWRGWPEGS